MKIKTRIFASNTVMVFVALAVLLIVSAQLLNAFEPRYNEAARRVMGEDVFKVEGVLKALPQGEIDAEALQKALEPYKYVPAILKGDEVIYSGVDQRTLNWLINWMKSDEQPPNGHGMVIVDNARVVRTQKVVDGQTYTVLAIWDAGGFMNDRQSPFTRFQKTFAITSLCVVAALMILSQVFTRMLSKRITKPLDALTQGVNRMENGDFSTPVAYRGDKEFQAVCEAFNQMQSSLKAEREKNAAYEKARTDMVASISHDLRTPLTSIKGYVKGLRDGVAQTPEKREQYLSIAYQKACDMDELLSRLLYFSKLETGSLPLFTVRTELRAFLNQYASEANRELAEKHAQISVDCEGDYPVLIDTEQMKRVLNNLVDNALKYAAAEPLKISLRAEGGPGRVTLTFSDNGRGVSEAQLPYLFEQFYRADEARGRQKGNGSGLGLYIVKYILRAHGGMVEAYSANGLHIVMTLPLEGAQAI